METGTDDPSALRWVAEQLAAEAAEYVRRRRAEVFGAGTSAAQQQDAVRAKTTPTDPVTVVDTETERLLRERLAELRPGDAVLGEEEGGPECGATEHDQITWVLDPIDGTVNFLYGIEAYAVSVGVQRRGVSVAGAVADVAAGAVYSAALGHGALMSRDGSVTALQCSAPADLSMALVGTGFAYDRARRTQQGRIVAALLPDVRDLRRIGSCALDLCMVAAGRLDAYFEEGVHVWDWAAAALIAEEAGAHVRRGTSPDGAGVVVAAAPSISSALDDALRRCGMAVGGDS